MLASPTVRFALFASASAATISVLMAFWPLWLTSRGLDATEIGVLGAVGLWVRVGATPLLGMLADRSGKPRLDPGGLHRFRHVLLDARSAHRERHLAVRRRLRPGQDLGLPDLPDHDRGDRARARHGAARHAVGAVACGRRAGAGHHLVAATAHRHYPSPRPWRLAPALASAANAVLHGRGAHPGEPRRLLQLQRALLARPRLRYRYHRLALGRRRGRGDGALLLERRLPFPYSRQ